MHSLTSIVRTGEGELPSGLELLGAPLVSSSGVSTAADAKEIGRVEGVVLDEEQQVVLFVARICEGGVATDRRGLVPLSAVSESAEGAAGAPLPIAWTREELRAHPVVMQREDLPDSPVNSGEPARTRWTLATPPECEINPHHAYGQALLWGLASAGAIGLGLVAVGGAAWVAVWAALFFGAGAGIAGYMNGAARDAVVHAREVPRPARVSPRIAAFEKALRGMPLDPHLLHVSAVELHLERASGQADPAAVTEQERAAGGSWDEIGRLLRSDQGKQRLAFDVLRIYLGVGLFVRGVLFVGSPELLDQMLRSHQFVLPVLLQHYIVLAHLAGGLLLALGLLTRLAAVFQLPALLGALLLVHLHDGLFAAGQALELSALVFVMLVAFAVAGAGPLSLDAHLARPARRSPVAGRRAAPEGRR